MKAIFKNKYTLITLIVVTALVLSAYAGLLSIGSGGLDTVCDNENHWAIEGYGELIGPRNRDGFIRSFVSTGYSESISIRGTMIVEDVLCRAGADLYKYVVELREIATGDWIIAAQPPTGNTITDMSMNCPPVRDVGYYLQNTGPYAMPYPYEFEVIGNDYDAIKCELWVKINADVLNPWSFNGWKVLQTDYAYLYSGIGGLYYHDTDEELSETPTARQTYEVGETVEISVHTGYGGQTIAGSDETSHTGIFGNQRTWQVMLRRPEDLEDSNLAGTIIDELTQTYDDNQHGTFSFEITEDMYDTNSNNEYSVEIYNVWQDMGALNVYAIDILGNAPSSVTFYADYQTEVGKKCTVSFDAIPNPLTGKPIQSFRVAVIYGTHQNLIPASGPSDPIWLIYKTDVPATNSGGYVTFTPIKEDYITVFANAQDSEGRTNLYPSCWTLWAYEGQPAPTGIIQDYVGFHWYEGGGSPWWQPTKPTGFWNNLEPGTQALLMAVITFATFLFLGSFLPKNQKIIAIIIGVIVAVIVYYWVSGAFGEIPEIPFLNTIKGIFLR